ncbi:DUF2254 domain-containing protein [Aureimonas jatrophae]|uniref:Uncharacterized membrane protein n=1 Tax=Aureimonas jatrophae TaxID=1166073 RepID=A0A1H0FDA5_9HYPH|nr:DUF2254 domain-containing protein [Aureimonas jatrophae]MBB3950070.1 putative membrane protein [Aureimonas jatrophae]SDN92640.1 Uncharacterized membrane protein [Aureimonas jatrophae]
MTSRWFWQLRRLSRRIWVRATLFSLGGVLTALAATVLSPYIPSDLPTKIGSDAVDNILGIIASSMLTVTTFSLSTMVSAYSAATSNVTPRATRLVIEDKTTHNVLSTFIGSFLFSLVGIIALSTGLYGDRGRVVLFAVTILVIAAIVVTLLRWIDHLSSLGRVTQTTERVEAVALEAMRERAREPYLGGSPLRDGSQIPRSARPVFAGEVGYVQHVDVGALSALAEQGSGRIFLRAIPGDLVDPTAPIALIDGMQPKDSPAHVRGCFTIGDIRSYDQDPRFGASVLTEIASRALSPGINDPGTAIDVVGRAVRLLTVWGEPPESEGEVAHPRVFVPPILIGDLFDDLFTPIARDGASTVEIGVRLQKAFRTLARYKREGFAENARRHSREALERAEAGLAIDADKRRLRALADEVGVA